MAGSLERPLTIVLDSAEDLSTRDVIAALYSVVHDKDLKCETQVGNQASFQITLRCTTARDTVLNRGFDVKHQHHQCYSIDRPRNRGPPPAFVSVKMRYVMSDETVTSLLNNYGQVKNIHRRCYSFAPSTETRVRIFTVKNPKGEFSTSHRIGRYVLRFYLRYAGQASRCYRCDSTNHQIRDCLQSKWFRRCHRYGSTDHLLVNVKQKTTFQMYLRLFQQTK